jgi:hypothetical protein
MNKSKKQIYRHPETNKFISKAEWESLQPKVEIKEGTQLTGADFGIDSQYIKDTKKFMEEIEKEFNNIKIALTQEVKPEVIEEEPSTWKLFMHKLKFWV